MPNFRLQKLINTGTSFSPSVPECCCKFLKAGRVCYISGVRDVRNPQGRLGGSFSEVSTPRPACRMLPRVLIFAVLFSKEVLPAEGASPAGMEMERDPKHDTCEPELKFLQSQVSPCPVVCGLAEAKSCRLSVAREGRGAGGALRRAREGRPRQGRQAGEVAGVRSGLRASDVLR